MGTITVTDCYLVPSKPYFIYIIEAGCFLRDDWASFAQDQQT
jgi:hypothetical protein